MDPSARAVLTGSPERYLRDLDLSEETFTAVPMSRETYRRSTFLDHGR